jgi:hypothetical protein
MWGRCNFGCGLGGVLRALRHGKLRHMRGGAARAEAW